MNGRAGPSNTSEAFYAGIQVSSTTFSVTPELGAELKFNLTVPFGCLYRGDTLDNCELIVQMVSKGDDGRCTNQITQNMPNCRTIIRQEDWNKEHSIKIGFKGTGTYTVGHQNTFIVKLVVAITDEIWHDYKLPSITMNVFDDVRYKKTIGSKCESHNDPHMITFDGRSYEHQLPGVYMLYEFKDQNRPMQVQIKLEKCWKDAAVYCNCGVAVRAGGDVFIADICDKKNTMQYRTCQDKILDVRRYKKNEKLYAIFLPTGTRVDITWSIGLFNVDITASAQDYNNTRGLCGLPNNNCMDDFLLRNNSQSLTPITPNQCNRNFINQHVEDFSISWRIDSPTENLFLPESDANVSLWNKQENVCECPEKYDNPDNFVCSPSKVVKCARDINYDEIGSKTCHVNLERKKRSIEYPWSSFQKRRRRRSAGEIVSNVTMTLQEALEYCKKTIGGSGIYKACEQIPNIQGDTTLETCAMDIKLSESLHWTQSTMETFKTGCLVEIQANNTLNEEQTNEAPTIAESILSILCPGFPECSGNGQCINGSCVCNDMFIASDCSIDKRMPPEIIGVRGDGLCDTSEIDCDTAFVVGEHIGSSPDLSCRLHRYYIFTSGERLLVETWVANASLETIMEVHCPLESQGNKRRKRSITDKFIEVFTLSISYDKEHFGDEHELVIFDSKCQIADLESNPPLFALKEKTCFIGGKCYSDGEQKAGDLCKVCDPMSPYIWSISPAVQDCSKVEPTTLAWIAGPVIGSVAVISVLMAIYCIYQKRALSKVNAFKDIK